jgi:hypothetical protein
LTYKRNRLVLQVSEQREKEIFANRKKKKKATKHVHQIVGKRHDEHTGEGDVSIQARSGRDETQERQRRGPRKRKRQDEAEEEDDREAGNS